MLSSSPLIALWASGGTSHPPGQIALDTNLSKINLSISRMMDFEMSFEELKLGGSEEEGKNDREGERCFLWW